MLHYKLGQIMEFKLSYAYWKIYYKATNFVKNIKNFL